jgi:hypothetical protein
MLQFAICDDRCWRQNALQFKANATIHPATNKQAETLALERRSIVIVIIVSMVVKVMLSVLSDS